MNDVTTLGIDAGKNHFHVIGTDRKGRRCFKQAYRRDALMRFVAQHRPVLIAMESCAGTHHLARTFQAYDHEVALLPAQYVKPYVKTNKTDFVDAAAIAEAVTRPDMPRVPIKSVEQQDLQALHRWRSQLVGDRTAVINALRAVLLERGLTVGRGRLVVQRELATMLESGELSSSARRLVETMRAHWRSLDDQIDAVSDEIEAISQTREDCRLLKTVPGIAAMTSTALVAAIGTGRQFKNGRAFASFLGLTPREHSTGGKQRLFGISKRGNSHLRELFMLGARSCVARLRRDRHQLGGWLDELESNGKHHNVVTAALANKLARIAWKVLTSGRAYEPVYTG